jgi:PAS domain S-box-containing protein
MTERKKPAVRNPKDSGTLDLPFSEDVLGSLVTSSRDLIYIVDRNGFLRYANERAAGVIQARPEELVGRPLADLIPIDDVGPHLKRFEGVLTTGEATQSETSFPLRGQETWLDTWLIPLKGEDGGVDAVLGISRDVTDRKLVERKLMEAAQRYRSLMETSPDSITVTDLEGNMLELNEQAVALYGAKDIEEMLTNRLTAFDYILPEDRARALDYAQKVLEHGSARNLQYRIIRKDGTYYWGELSASIVKDAEGNTKELIGVVRDITDRKRAELELQRRNEALARVNEQLELLHKAKDEFIATISHELRTPLVTGMGYVDLLLHGGLGPISARAGARMKVALKNLKRLSTLIDEILEYHKLADTARTGSLVRTTFDPVEVCRECVSDFQVRSGRSAETVAVETLGQVSRIWADENRIRQVISNLLNNADRHAGPDCRIRVRLWPAHKGGVGVAVVDDGAGIPDEIRDRVFEPFVKSPDTEEGTGLGLAIVRRILEAHGCEVDLISKPDKGASVSFVLPAVSAEATEAEQTGDAVPADHRDRSARVLVVEDDTETLDFLELALRNCGYRVEMVPTVKQALSAIQTNRPDMAIVDLTLPDADGLELCRIIRTDPATANMPICILTARAGDEAQKKARALGCDCYLIKPVSVEDLMCGVAELLKKNNSQTKRA